MQLNRPRLYAVLSANTMLRAASAASASNALVGFYLAALATTDPSINAALAGNLNAAFDAAALLVAIPFGTLIDRYSPRAVLVFGTLIGALATQLFGVSGVISIFFLSRILEGIASSATQPGILSYLTDATEGMPNARGRVMSWFEISLFLGLALGNLISGSLWERFNTGAFGIMAVFYVVAALIFSVAAKPTKSAQKKQSVTLKQAFEGFRDAIRDPFLQKLALPWLIFNSGIGLWLSQLAFQLNGPEREGQWLVGRLEVNQIAIFLFLYTVVFASGVYFFGTKIGRISRTHIMRVGFVAIFGSTFCFYMINISADWLPWTRWLLLPLYVISVAIQGGFTPAALSYLADVASASRGRGSAMGLYTMLLSLGNVVGSLAGGYLGNAYAFNGIMAASIVLGMLGFASMKALPRTDPLLTSSVPFDKG